MGCLSRAEVEILVAKSHGSFIGTTLGQIIQQEDF